MTNKIKLLKFHGISLLMNKPSKVAGFYGF